MGQDKWLPTEGNLEYASDLVKYIREKHDDYFCIAVAGYPEKHMEADSMDDDI